MIPFVLAILISFLLVPAASYLDRKRIPYILSNIIILSGFVVVLSLLFFIFYGALISISSSIPFYMSKYRNFVYTISNNISNYFNFDIIEKAKDFTVSQIFEIISPSSMVNTINRSVGSIISLLSQMLLLFLFLFFIISTRRVLISKVYLFFHAKRSSRNSHFIVLQKISTQIQTYLFLKTLISIGTGVLFGLSAFLMGLDFPVIWGFIGFVFNFIPTLGPIAASVPPTILAFLQFDNFLWAFLTSIFMSAIQFISGNFVEPMILGNRLNLNILAILLSLLLWGFIWGIPGMFLSVPIIAALNIVFRNIQKFNDLSEILSK
jgi:predicted PurR-regulated permease PerM